VVTAGSAWPYRGNGEGEGDMGGTTPGLGSTDGVEGRGGGQSREKQVAPAAAAVIEVDL
jgi:hypothetical protein